MASKIGFDLYTRSTCTRVYTVLSLFLIELLIIFYFINKIFKQKQSCSFRNADNKWNALAAHTDVVVFKLCELRETVFGVSGFGMSSFIWLCLKWQVTPVEETDDVKF